MAASLIITLLPGTGIAQRSVTLDEKIGQMLIIGFNGTQVDASSPVIRQIQRYNIGGVLLFDRHVPTQNIRNISNPAQTLALNLQLQRFVEQSNKKNNRPHQPLLIAIDYEGGAVDRLKFEYGFPETVSAAQIGQLPLSSAKHKANAQAATLLLNGFNLNFAPVLDVNINADNPVIGQNQRSFSADARQVARLGAIYSRAFSRPGLACVYKHFPGHGSSRKDSHLEFVDVTNSWQPVELLPYQLLLRQKTHCAAVMPGHIINRKLDPSGLPATLSHKMLTGLLRDTLHFKGVIISDDLQMKAIGDHYSLEGALVLAVNAGVDMLIFANQIPDEPQDPGEVIAIIKKKVKEGVISKERIDEAYQRIQTMKGNL